MTTEDTVLTHANRILTTHALSLSLWDLTMQRAKRAARTPTITRRDVSRAPLPLDAAAERRERLNGDLKSRAAAAAAAILELPH